MKKKKRTTRSKADKVPALVGRPEAYRKVYARMAYKLCLLHNGTTDKDLAAFFDVSEATINNWKIKHPKFLESINKGKTFADMDVVEKLFERATGYSHDDVYISTYEGEVIITPIIKHYPPDFHSMRLWLMNRADWKDKFDQIMSGKVILEPPEIT
jgi:hypothetical protein